jgi:hypothetical protein
MNEVNSFYLYYFRVLDVAQLNVNWNKPYIQEAPYVIGDKIAVFI